MSRKFKTAWQKENIPDISANLADIIQQCHKQEKEWLYSAGGADNPFYTRHKIGNLTIQNDGRINRLLPRAEPKTISDKIMYLGLTMRQKERQHPLVEEMFEYVARNAEINLDSYIHYELCSILHTLRAWHPLKKATLTCIEKFKVGDPRRSILSDWYILACYRLITPDIIKGNATDQLTILFKQAIEYTKQIAPELHKNHLVYEGLLAQMEGLNEEAIDLYIRSQNIDGILIGVFATSELFVPIEALKTTNLSQGMFTQCQHFWRHPASSEGIILVSSDKIYFERYANGFLSSFATRNPNSVIHWHCVNFAPSIDLISSYEKQLGIKINYSVDHNLDPSNSDDVKRGYYAAARYIYLPEYLAHYHKVATCDVDGVNDCSLKSLWHNSENTILLHTALSSKKSSSRAGWEAIAAGSSAFRLAPNTSLFCRTVSTYLVNRLEYALHHKEKYFYADQVGLFLAFIKLQEHCRIGNPKGLFKQGNHWAFAKRDTEKEEWQLKAMETMKGKRKLN